MALSIARSVSHGPGRRLPSQVTGERPDGHLRQIRGADTPAKDLAPESRGLEAIADGFRLLYDDDHAQLAAESVVYDALYAYCRRSTAEV